MTIAGLCQHLQQFAALVGSESEVRLIEDEGDFPFGLHLSRDIYPGDQQGFTLYLDPTMQPDEVDYEIPAPPEAE